MNVDFAYELVGPYREPSFDSPDKVEHRHLYFSLFEAQVHLVVGDCDFSPPWAWTPMMQFLVALMRISTKLRREDDARYLFTENEHEIRFHRLGEELTISTTYSPCIAVCDVDGFASAIETFATDTVEELRLINPLVGSSPAFAEFEGRMFSEPA